MFKNIWRLSLVNLLIAWSLRDSAGLRRHGLLYSYVSQHLHWPPSTNPNISRPKPRNCSSEVGLMHLALT